MNTTGGVIHYLGIGWACDYERPVSALPGHDREIAFPLGGLNGRAAQDLAGAGRARPRVFHVRCAP
jgi:hypothetical protein